jgi:hypothetical protein
MPSDMPKTGLGGASQDQNTWVWMLMGLFTIVAASSIVIRKKALNQQ